MPLPRLPRGPREDRHIFCLRVSPRLWSRFRTALQQDGRVATPLFIKWIEDYLRARGGSDVAER